MPPASLHTTSKVSHLQNRVASADFVSSEGVPPKLVEVRCHPETASLQQLVSRPYEAAAGAMAPLLASLQDQQAQSGQVSTLRTKAAPCCSASLHCGQSAHASVWVHVLSAVLHSVSA